MPTTTMLVGITFGMPRQSRQLAAVAGQIETQNHAERGTVKASIHYFKRREGNREVDGLKTLKTFQTSWRSALEHYARYPFAAGMKLLPATLVEQFMQVNQQFVSRKEAVYSTWQSNEYPSWSQSGPSRMGSLYDPDDFPNAADCMKRFVCDVTVVPLAETDQWQRIAVISPDLAATMANQQNEITERMMKQAHAKLWADVMKPIQNIVDQLSKDKTKIHESLIGNVIAITDLIPAYNEIHQDPQLTAVAASIKASLSQIKPEDLRTSGEAKTAALEKAKDIIATYEPYARSFAVDDEE